MKSIFKMSELLHFSEFYTAIKDTALPIKQRYFLAKLNKRIDEERLLYREQLQSILDKYAEKDENGKLIPVESGGIKLIPGTQNECQAAISELDNMEIEIDFDPINLSDLGDDLKLTAAQIEAILPFTE